MQSSGKAAGIFRIAAEGSNHVLQLTYKSRSLLSEFVKKCLNVSAFHTFGGLFESFLSVAARFNKSVQRRDHLVVGGGSIGSFAKSIRHRCRLIVFVYHKNSP